MSFWRDLNKGFNNVIGAASGVVGGLGIPGVSGVANMIGGVVQAGQSQGNTGVYYMPPEISGGDVVVTPKKDNTMMYIGIGLLVFLVLRKKIKL